MVMNATTYKSVPVNKKTKNTNMKGYCQEEARMSNVVIVMGLSPTLWTKRTGLGALSVGNWTTRIVLALNANNISNNKFAWIFLNLIKHFIKKYTYIYNTLFC